MASYVTDNYLPFGRTYSNKVMSKAHECIQKREEEKSRKFWHEHPDVLYQLKVIPTMRDLNVSLHIPKTVFLTRLLFPVSPSNLLLPQLLKSVFTEIESLSQPLAPAESRTTRIIQSLRVLLQQQSTRASLIKLLETEDRQVTKAENKSDLANFSFRNLLLSCINYPLEIPAKEEALYFIAALAMNFSDASSDLINVYLLNVLEIYRDSFRQVDEHVVARRKAKEQHELTLMTARFQVNTIARFLPPVFSYKRYKHKGNFAGHRMRSLSLFTVAIIMHFWKRTSAVQSLILQCCECDQVSRLHLLNLLQIVMDNWPPTQGKKLAEAVNNSMKELLKCKERCGEQGQKKSVEIINECHKRFRFIRMISGCSKRFSTVATVDKKKAKPKKV